MMPMKYIKAIIAITIIISVSIFIQATDYKEVITSVREVGSNFIILILTTGAAYMLGTLSWKYSMGKQMADISLGRLFLIRHAGETISLLNPMGIVGGEAAKVQLLAPYIESKKAIFASIIISRAIMIFTQLILFVATAAFLFIQDVKLNTLDFDVKKWFIPAVSATGALIFMLLVMLRHKTILNVIIQKAKLGRLLIVKTKVLGLKLKDVYAEIIKLCTYSRKAVMLAIVFALLHWIAGALEFYLILQFLGVKVSVLQAILIDMGVIFFKAAGAFIPGQIGIEELGNKMMLSVVGVHDAGIWITILRRSRQLVWIAFGICIYLFLYKIRLSTPDKPNGSALCKS